MSSTTETGHAKNVANFQNLIAFVTGYGATYSLSKNALKLPQHDTLGRLLVAQEVNLSNFRLDISNQNKGVYLLKVVTDNGSSIEKIVKE